MVGAWLQVLRIPHWVKNLFVLGPLLFARHLFDGRLLLEALAALGIFCLLSSGVYLFNDVCDAERDRVHPLKRLRPIAAGRIPTSRALLASFVMVGLGLAGAFWLRPAFGWSGLGYLSINLLYSAWLKRVAFLDVLLIAAGFVLRVVAGALAIEVEFSIWLIVCTFFLASLLGFGKRRHELATVTVANNTTRPSLGGYSERSLRWAEFTAAALTVLLYLWYSIAPGTVAKFGSYLLVCTIPFPLYGIFRYLQLVESRRDRSPTEALVTDAPSWVNGLAWVVVVVLVLYHG